MFYVAVLRDKRPNLQNIHMSWLKIEKTSRSWFDNIRTQWQICSLIAAYANGPVFEYSYK